MDKLYEQLKREFNKSRVEYKNDKINMYNDEYDVIIVPKGESKYKIKHYNKDLDDVIVYSVGHLYSRLNDYFD